MFPNVKFGHSLFGFSLKGGVKLIKSMTSFGRAQSEEGKDLCFSIEMKSVNHRYLDINIRMPRIMLALEEKIRNIISKKLNRGKVDVFINYKNYGNNAGKPNLNIKLAKEYYECLKQIQNELNVIDDISITKIARLSDVITLEEPEESLDNLLNEISPLIESALDLMDGMRKKEGEKLKEDILAKVQMIELYVKEIEKVSDNIPKNYKKKLEERLSELLSGVDIDESRIALEVAILSDKAAVDEEITRLRSHLSQIKSTLDLEEPIGRKLDFIIQEINREANTIASKSTDINMTNKVIEVKNTIEKIREQVQNIE
ncbi:hypothetical protein CLPUN_47160 [Clostridium puniceum]|uniref:YicC family protein n=1 Tax=Clostridium puniceum TaxID=29367 RepID=A0A1S8T3I8_9CLOT|nr:hypothetical protein CLPUN_47160 [Clostridium puniceum]